MQRGANAVGGRKYQIAAVVITYLAIAGSYFALAARALAEAKFDAVRQAARLEALYDEMLAAS